MTPAEGAEYGAKFGDYYYGDYYGDDYYGDDYHDDEYYDDGYYDDGYYEDASQSMFHEGFDAGYTAALRSLFRRTSRQRQRYGNL